MTTRIHIVNFGPEAIEVKRGSSLPVAVHSQESLDTYVYDDVTISEKKPEKKPE